jgi:hypothetical protein
MAGCPGSLPATWDTAGVIQQRVRTVRAGLTVVLSWLVGLVSVLGVVLAIGALVTK